MLDGTERNPQNLTYTCVVRMERRRWYINLKKNMQEKDGNKKKKERKHRLKKKNVKSKRTVSITKIKRSLYQL